MLQGHCFYSNGQWCVLLAISWRDNSEWIRISYIKTLKRVCQNDNHSSNYTSLSKKREEEIWCCFGFKCWSRLDLRHGFVRYIHKAHWCNDFNLLLKTGATRLTLDSRALKNNTVKLHIWEPCGLETCRLKFVTYAPTCKNLSLRKNWNRFLSGLNNEDMEQVLV